VMLQVDLILSLDSFLSVFKLGRLWWTLWWTECMNKRGANRKAVYFGRALACIAWVILTLVSDLFNDRAGVAGGIDNLA
jgi:hypothetical protein